MLFYFHLYLFFGEIAYISIVVSFQNITKLKRDIKFVKVKKEQKKNIKKTKKQKTNNIRVVK